MTKHRRYNSEDLRLLKSAHTSSSSINKIVQGNFLETDLLQSIDAFIASIERKLDRMEVFFGARSDGTKAVEGDSAATLVNLYDTLITIKNSVFNSSVPLETFNTIMDEHYGGLLSSLEATESLGVHEKLLTALHFLDAKINEFNQLVESEAKYLLGEEQDGDEGVTEQSAAAAIKLFELKFHNYEEAVREGGQRLLHYYELPFPWRENPYIIHGYRFKSSYSFALKSICTCHNETLNVWTHLLGALLFVYIALVSFPKTELYMNNSFTDNCVIYFFFASAIKCLMSSTFWHAFNGTANLYLRKKFACIDYTGITVLVTASVVASEYTSMYHHPWIQMGLISFSLACGFIGFFLNWSSHFDSPKSKTLRISFYIFLGALGMCSFFVLAFDKGFGHALKYFSPITRSVIWYLTGVVFYASLAPEKFRTDVIVDTSQPDEGDLTTPMVTENLGAYFLNEPQYTEHRHSIWSMWWIDYVFQSHNIWHVFVLLGALGHWTATYEMFQNISMNK